MIDNPPPARTSGGRPVSWFLCSIPLLAAGTLVAVRYGRSHNAAYTAGAVISTWFVGVLIAAGLRFAYIRSRDRRLHIIAPATLLIAGVTSLLADIGQVAADVGKNKTALSAARSDIVACVNSDQGPFTAPPRGYSYRPLAGSQRQTIEQGNATIASSPLGAGGARYDGRELIRRSTPVATVLVVAGMGYPKYAAQFEQGVSEGAVRQGGQTRKQSLPGGRHALIIGFSGRGALVVTSSRCYGAIVTSADSQFAGYWAGILSYR